MRIHVLSVSPMSDAQKKRLEGLGHLRYFDAVLGDAASLPEQVSGAEILVVTPRLPADITPYLDESCRFISVQAAGVDALNLDVCRSRGIVVSNVPEFCTDAVAEHAFALLLASAKRLEQGRALLNRGGWDSALAFTTASLRGKTLGLFGCGRIGSRIAEVAGCFGLETIATVHDPGKGRAVEAVPFDELLGRSDFLVLAAPATPETVNLFDRKTFAKMKPGAMLVNVSRGSLIVEADLIAALDKGRLAGAATDVYRVEPPPADDPLLGREDVIVSPHVAWGSTDALERLLEASIDNVQAFLKGAPTNVVV